MAKDYVVRFTGEDNLSQTISKIKSELKDFGGDAQTISNKVEQIDRALNNSNYKRAQKEIQNVLVTMERLGQGSSATAVHLRELGSSIVDMVCDARQELRLMSSDTANLDAAVEGFSLIASTASIATGAMALFGDENQNVTEAIAKVQGAMGILNGIQQVSNMLNKDSILMLQLKSKWQAIKEAATIKDTVATTANNVAESVSKVNSQSAAVAKGIDTVATVAHTTATASSTIATQAWNTAKAISKALLGDFTGLVIVGAAGLAAYALSTSKSTDETEKLNTSTKKVSDTFTSTYASSLAQTRTKYEQLRYEYTHLKNEHQRVEWIRENKTEFDNLGISVNSVTDAENAFINNTDKMLEALDLRAQAVANQNLARKHYERAAAAKKQLRELNEKVTAERQAEDTREGMKDAIHGNVHKVKKKRYVSTGPGAQHLQQVIEQNEKDAQYYTDYSAKLSEQADKITGKPSSNRSTSRSTNRSTPPHSSSTSSVKSTKEVAPEGSIKWYNDKISENKAKIELSIDPKERAKLQKQIDDYKFEINKINFNDSVIANGIQDNTLKDTKDIISEQLSNIKVPTIKDSLKDLKEALNELGAPMDNLQQMWDDFGKMLNKYKDSPLTIAQGLSAMGATLQELGASGPLAKAGAVMAAIGQIILSYAQAAVQAASLGPIAWIGFAAAGLAQVAAVVSSIKGFSNGGIIQGMNSHGDMSIARVNSGEMILNGSQQRKLFDLLDSGGGVGNNIGGNVVFTISGSNLKGVLRNYDSKMSKIK